MQLAHIGIWVEDLERTRQFYETYFGARTGAKYANVEKAFTSYFLTFNSGAQLEIMHRPDIAPCLNSADTESLGYAHLAIAVGSEAAVNALTDHVASDGYKVLDGPRHTGDGCYESVILDPENNRVEITV